MNARCAACNGIASVEVWEIKVNNWCIFQSMEYPTFYTQEYVYDLITKGSCGYSISVPSDTYHFCGRAPEKQCAPNCANKELVDACVYSGTQQVRVGGEVFANKYCAPLWLRK